MRVACAINMDVEWADTQTAESLRDNVSIFEALPARLPVINSKRVLQTYSPLGPQRSSGKEETCHQDAMPCSFTISGKGYLIGPVASRCYV